MCPKKGHTRKQARGLECHCACVALSSMAQVEPLEEDLLSESGHSDINSDYDYEGQFSDADTRAAHGLEWWELGESMHGCDAEAMSARTWALIKLVMDRQGCLALSRPLGPRLGPFGLALPLWSLACVALGPGSRPPCPPAPFLPARPLPSFFAVALSIVLPLKLIS